MANKTYGGQTALQILHSAKIVSNAGLYEVWVTPTLFPSGCVADLGERRSGGTVEDLLCLRGFDGHVVNLYCGPRALQKLQSLCAARDKKQAL